jgi:hypothetical protein
MPAIIRLVGALLLITLLGACSVSRGVDGSGNLASDERAVSGFHEVELSGFGTLNISRGERETLMIEAEDNILPLIKTEVRNGRLVIEFEEKGPFNTQHPVVFNLNVKDLDVIDVSGAGKVVAADLEAEQLTVAISGAADMELAGKVDTQVVSLSGGSNYNGKNLASAHALVDISGTGDVTLRVSDTLDATISGAGSISYIGDPQVSRNISGIGSVNKVGDE